MPDSEPKPRFLHWLALLLLVISVCINYADRGNLGVAARSLESDLHLSQDQLGLLLGSISFTYSLFQIVSGKLIDRWNVYWVYAAGFLFWSAATGLTGLANSFTVILVLRLILGIGESVAYPSYAKIIVHTFPEELRGTVNGLIDAGSKLGPAIGVLLGVKMLGWFTWRGMFLVIGISSLVWLLPWSLVAWRLPNPHHPLEASDQGNHEPERSPGYRDLMQTRKMWGTAIGLFGGNYAWFFFLNWLPYYFENERHYTRDRLAIIGSLPFWAVALSSILFGPLADVLIRRGANAGKVRQRFVCFGILGCCAFMLPAVMVRDERIGNVLLIGAFVCLGVWASNHWALTQLLSGKSAAGKWTGLQNCLGNFAGVLGPVISGFALQATHSFFAAFAIACVVLLVGVLGYSKVVGTPSEVRWPNFTLVTSKHRLTYIGRPAGE
jgi:MFS transporter, ACS family, D-galactonate transporter